MLLTTYNHWLKKNHPKRMQDLGKLGLSVEFQTVKPNDAAIDPAVMLTIVDAQGVALYSWNGEHCVGGVGDVKAMATNMMLAVEDMLSMLRARHVYMAVVGADLPQSCHETAKSKRNPKKSAVWAVGTAIEFRAKFNYELLDAMGVDYLRDVYEEAAKPELHPMVCTQAVMQITGVNPLVAAQGAALVIAQSEDSLNFNVSVDVDGLRFTLRDYWLELSYGWEMADFDAVMSWSDLKQAFGVDDKVFHITYGINGGNVKDALCQSLMPIVGEQTLELPANFDLA